MKHTKKLFSVLLTLVMALALAVPAFAAGTNSITVNNAKAGENYSIYKMLDLSVNEANTAYSYTVNSNWKNFFTNGGAGAAYVDIDSQGYVIWKADKQDASSMEAFGKAAAAFASDNSVPTAANDITPSADGTITFEGLEPGYYLITSTYGTLAIVETTPTNPSATVEEKNPGTDIVKEVQEDSDSSWGEENSAQIGDTVYFRTTVTIKKGAVKYIVHDKMDDGLTFNTGSIAVNVLTKDTEGKDVTTPLTEGREYTVVTTGLADGCTFEVRFTQTYLDTITEDTTVVITYNAVLNEKADITYGENNDSKVTWGNASDTEWDRTNTKTYQFDILKYDAKDTAKNPLAGATFQLKDASGNVVKLIKVSDTEYRVANGNETGAVDSFTTVGSGKIVIKGVDLDTYTLVETAAPEGYNTLKDPVSVTVLATNALTVEVPNQSGTELPSTGGMGTTLFYTLGSILVLGAGVLLVTKKRMSEKA